MTNQLRTLGRIACAVAALATAAQAADLNPKFIMQVYQDVLGRQPNRIEYTTWLSFVGQGGTRSHVAAVLTSSAEYRSDLVEGWHMQYLHRSANAGELAFSVQMMMNGATDKQTRAMIVGSDEYWQKAGSTYDGFIRQMFADLLGRPPSPGETNAIIAILIANGVNGVRTAGAAAVENTVEFDQREVGAIHQKFLRRNPTNAELSFWTQMLVAAVPEELIIDQVMGSDEYLRFSNTGR